MMADMIFWERLYGALLTEEKAKALKQRFEEALREQIEAWVQEILDGIKEDILKKAQAGEYTCVGRMRYIRGEYGTLCGNVMSETDFYELLLDMEKAALLNHYPEIQCTDLPEGGKCLQFDALRQIGGLGPFGTEFSQKLEETGSHNWIKIGVREPVEVQAARSKAEKRERIEMHIQYFVAI